MKMREPVKLITLALGAILATFVLFFGLVILLAELNSGGPMPLPQGEVQDLQGILHSS